jgi:hypothetical protein
MISQGTDGTYLFDITRFLCFDRQTNAELGKRRIWESIAKAMTVEPFIGLPSTICGSCGAIEALSWNCDNRTAIGLTASVWNALFAVMLTHVEAHDVVSVVCRTLLGFGSNCSSNQVEMAKASGHEITMAAMNAHLGSSDIQELGTGMLAALTELKEVRALMPHEEVQKWHWQRFRHFRYQLACRREVLAC